MLLETVGESLELSYSRGARPGVPPVEVAFAPSTIPVSPQLAQGVPQNVTGVEGFIGFKQRAQLLLGAVAQVLGIAQEVEALARDEFLLAGAGLGRFPAADFVHGIVVVLHDVEAVIDDDGFRAIVFSDGAVMPRAVEAY